MGGNSCCFRTFSSRWTLELLWRPRRMDDCWRHWIAVRLRCLVLLLLQDPAPPQGAQLATRYKQVEDLLLHRGLYLHVLHCRTRLVRYWTRSRNMFGVELLLPSSCRHWNPCIHLLHHPGCHENSRNPRWSLWILDSIPPHKVGSIYFMINSGLYTFNYIIQVFFVRNGHLGYPWCLDLAGGLDEDVCGINFGDNENDVPILYLHPHDGFHCRPLQH